MPRSYLAGVRLVLGTIVVAALICGAAVTRMPPRTPRAAEDLGVSARSLGDFRLQERSGKTVTAAELSDRVAIASFIFTRCALSCPRITGIMKDIQGSLARSNVQLASFSVDPDHDTPEVLRAYAERYGASSDRWWFLTGDRAALYSLLRDRFQLGVVENAAPAGPDVEAITHSDRLALIDHGQIVGLFDSSDRPAIDALVARARRLALPAWVRSLPTVNATLNGLSACLLFAGWLFIRRYRLVASKSMLAPDGQPSAIPLNPSTHLLVKSHTACMIAAIGTSTLFLACYLVYHARAGSMPFGRGGLTGIVYFTILLSHTLLATLSVPLILVTVRRAWAGRFDRHVAIASLTLPIWLYVAVTGVVIYLMLYHLPVVQSPGLAGM